MAKNRYSNAKTILFSADLFDQKYPPGTKKIILSTIRFPDIPLSSDDIQAITTEGDRLDLLAQQFYGDSDLWWIISRANPSLKQNSIFIPVGSQIRIPILIQNILASYYLLNTK
jgi:phage tail protein X